MDKKKGGFSFKGKPFNKIYESKYQRWYLISNNFEKLKEFGSLKLKVLWIKPSN